MVRGIAGASLLIAIASTAGADLQSAEAGQRSQAPVSSVFERTFSGGAPTPWRVVEKREVSGNREVTTETFMEPDVNGDWRASGETVTTVDRRGPEAVTTRRDVFAFDFDRRRRLSETVQSEQERLGDAEIRTVRTTWTADVNGRLMLTSREVETRTPAGSDVHST